MPQAGLFCHFVAMTHLSNGESEMIFAPLVDKHDGLTRNQTVHSIEQYWGKSGTTNTLQRSQQRPVELRATAPQNFAPGQARLCDEQESPEACRHHLQPQTRFDRHFAIQRLECRNDSRSLTRRQFAWLRHRSA